MFLSWDCFRVELLRRVGGLLFMEIQTVWTIAIFRKVFSKFYISISVYISQCRLIKFQLVCHLYYCFLLFNFLSFISDCFWMLDALLEYTSTGHLPSIFKDHQSQFINKITDLPQRMEGNHLYR